MLGLGNNLFWVHTWPYCVSSKITRISTSSLSNLIESHHCPHQILKWNRYKLFGMTYLAVEFSTVLPINHTPEGALPRQIISKQCKPLFLVTPTICPAGTAVLLEQPCCRALQCCYRAPRIQSIAIIEAWNSKCLDVPSAQERQGNSIQFVKEKYSTFDASVTISYPEVKFIFQFAHHIRVSGSCYSAT